MRRVLSFLFPLVVLIAAAMPLYAQPMAFNTGETLGHSLSVCMEKQDALDILNAHKNEGVGKVIYAVQVEGGTFSAVEIIWEGEVVGYFLTSAPVNKAQRNS